MVPLDVQLAMLGLTTAVGVVAGLVFDVYRLGLRPRSHPWLRLGTDVLVWLLLALLVYGSLWVAFFGDVRLYVFLGLALGYALYAAIFRPPVERAIRTALGAWETAKTAVRAFASRYMTGVSHTVRTFYARVSAHFRRQPPPG